MEKEIVKFLNNFQWKPLDFLSWLISKILFLTFLWILVILGVIIADPRAGITLMFEIGVVFVIHYIFSEVIIKYGSRKFSLARKRPYVAFPDEIRPIGKNFSYSSFPSSHVSSVVGGLVILYAAFPFAWPAYLIFLILLSLSRLHNGMHYPTDILAGILLGMGYGWIALFIFKLLL